MTLDEKLYLTRDVPTAFIDPDQRRAELLADILAIAGSGDGIDAAAFQTRPSVLRRIATLIAEALPDRFDRLVTDPAGVAVTTALALYTGLPFAVFRPSDVDTIVDGDVHRGEQVTVVEPVIVTGTARARLIDRIHTEGARVAGVVGVIDDISGGHDPDVPVNALFHLAANPVATTKRGANHELRPARGS